MGVRVVMSQVGDRMKSTVLVSLLTLALTGCQVSIRLGGASGVTQQTHEAPATPSPNAVSEAAPAAVQTAPPTPAPQPTEPVAACPASPPPVECPSPEPAAKASSEEQTSTSNADAVESKETPSNEANEEQPQQAESEDPTQATPVVAEEKPTVPTESFDIEKYVEQSSSCVQQNPCAQPQMEEKNSQAPKVADEVKVIEPAKPSVPTSTDAVQERRSAPRDSGIQRVDRRRPVSNKTEMPPDMPR